MPTSAEAEEADGGEETIGGAMDSVVLLWHVRHVSDGDDDEKLIGVYRTEDDARAAVERLRDKPGFRDLPEGFECHTYVLNRDGWTEGFVSGVEGLGL